MHVLQNLYVLFNQKSCNIHINDTFIDIFKIKYYLNRYLLKKLVLQKQRASHYAWVTVVDVKLGR